MEFGGWGGLLGDFQGLKGGFGIRFVLRPCMVHVTEYVSVRPAYSFLPNANKEEAYVHDISTFRKILEDAPVSASIPRMGICFLRDYHNLHS